MLRGMKLAASCLESVDQTPVISHRFVFFNIRVLPNTLPWNHSIVTLASVRKGQSYSMLGSHPHNR